MKTRSTVFGLMILILLTVVSCQSLNRITPAGADDEAIEAELRARILAEIPNKTFAVGISVDKGHVTIDGVVDTAEDRSIITDLAWDIEGVRRVTNRLGVRP